MSLAEAIAAIPWFVGLTPDQIQSLARIAGEQNFRRDEIIFSEGDDSSGLYVVRDGRVKIFKLSPEGKEQILHVFDSGEVFGEVAVFTGRKFPAYAQAMTPTTTLFFPRPMLIDVIRRNPEVGLSMLAVLSLRLRRFANLIEDLSLKEVPSRLAAYLLYLSSKNQGALEFDLDITKTQLASFLGTIPETLSRILARLAKGEFIEVSGRRVVLKDMDALKDLAEAQIRLE
jgi:CRP/FNR family transcriptional regulator